MIFLTHYVGCMINLSGGCNFFLQISCNFFCGECVFYLSRACVILSWRDCMTFFLVERLCDVLLRLCDFVCAEVA